MALDNIMAKPGQKTITLTGKTLASLEKYYKKESNESLYSISFAEFVAKHALRDIERGGLNFLTWSNPSLHSCFTDYPSHYRGNYRMDKP